MGVVGVNTSNRFEWMQCKTIACLNLNSSCYSCSDLTLRSSRRNLHAGPRTMFIEPPTKRIANKYIFWNKRLIASSISYHLINLKLLACYYCKNSGNYNYCSEANAYYNPPH